jgi:mannitol repressor
VSTGRGWKCTYLERWDAARRERPGLTFRVVSLVDGVKSRADSAGQCLPKFDLLEPALYNAAHRTMGKKPTATTKPLHKLLFAESDRGCVLIAHATIDKALESVIRLALSIVGGKNKPLAFHAGTMRGLLNSLLLKERGVKHKPESVSQGFTDQSSIGPLFESSRGPLSSTWAKIEMANALGLLTNEIYGDLHLIRRLRNECAHNIDSVDFLESKMHERVEKLSQYKAYSKMIPRRKLVGPDNSMRPMLSLLSLNHLDS